MPDYNRKGQELVKGREPFRTYVEAKDAVYAPGRGRANRWTKMQKPLPRMSRMKQMDIRRPSS